MALAYVTLLCGKYIFGLNPSSAFRAFKAPAVWCGGEERILELILKQLTLRGHGGLVPKRFPV